jgi:CBS-domain-containing membrane protein
MGQTTDDRGDWYSTKAANPEYVLIVTSDRHLEAGLPFPGSHLPTANRLKAGEMETWVVRKWVVHGFRRLAVLQRRERRRGRRVQPHFQLAQIGVTSLGGLLAVGLLALLSAWSGQVLIVAPLGASSVLLFGYPRSPLAQPRNVVLGNTLGGFLGVALVALFGQGPLVLAMAVGLTILLGQQLRCLHPPAGGLAFLAAFLGVGWPFLLVPVLSGSLLLVLLAWGFSRWVPGAMPYPRHWL